MKRAFVLSVASVAMMMIDVSIALWGSSTEEGSGIHEITDDDEIEVMMQDYEAGSIVSFYNGTPKSKRINDLMEGVKKRVDKGIMLRQ